jgi:chorismate-pyruvate lyase
MAIVNFLCCAKNRRRLYMLNNFYQIPEETTDWRALRSDGYLGDAKVRGPDGRYIPLAELPPLLRTLLVTDGTVTKVLEAYFWEPVDVRAEYLEVVRPEQAIPWLNLNAGAEVLARRVQLVGEQSGTLYAEAFSVVRLDEFDTGLQQSLVEGSVGIGVLLRESGLETYREIMTVGVESGPDGLGGEWVYRTYRIICDKKPVILIRESFPWGLYGS